MADIQQDVPLAPIQEHFWGAGTAAPADGSQTECVAVRIDGALDRGSLQRALSALFERHEILRSIVVDEHGTPALRVLPASPEPPLSWADITDLADADPESALAQELASFAKTILDPAVGPLLRFRAVRMHDDTTVLALAVHHLVSDATSVRILLSEISRDYTAALHGQPSPIAAPELQYADFAVWERDVLLPEAEKTDTDFWRKTLHGAPDQLDLRPDRPRPAVKGTLGRRTDYLVGGGTGSSLLSFARAHRTTPFAAALAAFAALVTRSTGIEDFLLGTLCANRTTPEIEQLIGQFANTVPLRVGTGGDPGFAELASRCAAAVADAVDHGRLPLSRITDLAGRRRDPSRTPLVQHLFLPAVDAIGEPSFGGAAARSMPVRRERGRFDTIVEVAVEQDGVRIWVEYDSAVYTEHGIDILVDDYERILRTWSAAPDTPLSSLPMAGLAQAGPARLASALGLNGSDTVGLPGDAEEAAQLSAAAAAVGARILDSENAADAAIILVSDGKFGTYTDMTSAQTLIASGPVPAADLARLREDAGRRAYRLINLSGDTVLAAELTHLPARWPVLLGGDEDRLRIGDGRTSPYSPATLHFDGAATALTVRRNPQGELELVDGLELLSEPPQQTGTADPDDTLLALICLIWAQALEVSQLDAQADFFVEGGHSMIAARLIADLADSLGVAVSLRTLFENPTPVEFVAELRKLHPRLDDLLAYVADESDGADGYDDQVVEPRTAAQTEPGSAADGRDQAVRPGPAQPTEPFPLLAAQRQLWLAEQANPGALTHTIPLLLQITGPVDESALRAAVSDVVERQDGLRAVFIEAGGEPVQRIVPYGGFDVPIVDLRDLPAADRAARNSALGRDTAYSGFDIATGPLLRARLVRLGDEQCVLHLLFHHLVTDEVSMTIFMRELSAFYVSRVEGRPAALVSVPTDMREIVRAEQELLAGPEGERLRRFWIRTLTGAPRLVLPTDRPRPAKPTFAGEFLSRPASPELGEAITACARQHRTTAFTVFCTGVVALLHRLTGQTDVVLGVPTENRTVHGSQALIGCFLNVLPLRVDCSADPSFADLLDRVGRSLLRAYENQRLPFAEIVESVRTDRVPGVHPIYQVTSELQLANWIPLQLPGCETSYELVSHGTARYDLSFHALMQAGGAAVMLEVNTDLWDRETGLGRIDQVGTLLARATADPALPLSGLGC
ncbi:MAG TPA: condensation domain-containing protein [Actinocrinis sp.]|nr:condensation domain-containing protein [Actinocrinis sp.]